MVPSSRPRWRRVAARASATGHSIFHSIYFLDANGHRVELAAPDPEQEESLARLDAVKWDMLEEWSRTKKAPKHADWLHAKERRKAD